MYYSIQICRGVAALMVLLGHVGGSIAAEKYFGIASFGIPFSFGHAGVEFFFVLSGFIITHVHAADIGRPERLVPYLRKRIVRIYPAYLIVFFVTFFAAMPFPSIWATMPHDLQTIVVSLLLLPQSLGGIHDHIGAPVVGVAWSLQYEMVFYAFVACLIASRGLATLLVAALLVNFATCWIGSGCEFPRSFFATTWIPLFALGMATAYIAKNWKIRHPWWLVAIGTAGFLATGLAEVLTRADPFMSDPRVLYGSFSAILIVGLVAAEKSGALRLRPSFMTTFGDASYALYLIHSPIVSVMCKLAMALGLRGLLGASVSYVVILAVCIFGSIAFYLWVERPIQRYLSRPSRPPQTAH